VTDAAPTARFVLRPATTNDVDAVTDVWHRGWRESHLGHVPDALVAYRSPHHFRERVAAVVGSITVAVADERVMGLVIPHDDEIEQLYVADAGRGTGIAAALLRHGESTIARRFDTAFLAVVAGNHRARRFYGREGWHDAGAFDYEAWTAEGDRIAVACRRYEKSVR
jgi:GNAT superfamily N-acetyltransferase